jgi:hypothetical protein
MGVGNSYFEYVLHSKIAEQLIIYTYFSQIVFI